MQAVRKTALTVCVQIKPQLLQASFALWIQVSAIIFEYGHFSRMKNLANVSFLWLVIKNKHGVGHEFVK